MTKGLKIWLYACIAGVCLGAALLLGTAANAADGSTPKPETTSSATTSDSGGTDWFAPGGILTVSLGGIFLIVREVKSIKDMDLQKYKTRAEAAEAKADTETAKLASQIERLERKLDSALADVEKKHDEMVAEVAHRRQLEVLLAQHGIAVPAGHVTVTTTTTLTE
jgi:hypothetical protein